jgi:cell division protein FtsQ
MDGADACAESSCRLGAGAPRRTSSPVLLGALPASLGERLADVAYVDLRYTNGFAIGWISRIATRQQ